MTQSAAVRALPLQLAVASFVVTSVGLMRPGNAAEAWQKAQLMLRQGRYEQALHLADQTARNPGGRTPKGRAAVLLAARAETALGLLASARRRLEQAVAQAPQSLPIKAELARVAMAQGDRGAVHMLLEASTNIWNDKSTDRSNPANLVAMATIAQLGQSWTWGNDLFREAVKRAPTLPDPNVAWGQLFMEKHAASEAATSFKQALKADPKHPDALVGLARTELERGYDRGAADRALTAALTENPRHTGALALRAEIALDGEDFAQTETLITTLRNINPHDSDADWLQAAIAKLRSDEAQYVVVREARLSTRQGDGDFFANVAEALVRHRRYHDARIVAEECLLQAPRDPRCRTSLGTTLLRLGEEEKGLATLREAFAADPYNTRTFNQLQLFDKTIKNNYKVVESAHFRFRIRSADEAAIDRIVAPFLESVFDRYVKRYGYTPPKKVMFELYGDPAQFAVRTVGLPALDVSAVCFGPVITALSPTLGKNNWALILAHELAHVFSLGLSRERVPRWLTEGLAEWETTQNNPQWRRHDDLAFWGALKRKTLPPLGQLSLAFFNAQSNEEAVSAYLYSSHTVEFMIQRFGFAGIRKMLVDFGAGKTEQAVLQSLSGGTMANLQRDFQQHLDARYPGFAAQFLPNSTDRLNLAEALAKIESPAASADDFARAAMAAMEANFVQKATGLWQQGDTLWKRSPKAPTGRDRTAALLAYAWATLAEGNGAPPENIIRNLTGVIDRGFDGYDVRTKAAMAAVRANRLDVAQAHLQKAVQLMPDEVEGWTFLAEVLEQKGNVREALAARIRAFVLDAQSAKQGIDLLQQCEEMQAADLVLLLAPWVIEVTPANAKVHATYARALSATGKNQEALTQYGHALAFGADNAADIKVSVQQLQKRLGPQVHALPQPVGVRAAPRGPAPRIPAAL